MTSNQVCEASGDMAKGAILRQHGPLIGICLTIGLIDYIGARDETMLKILLPVTLTYAVGISGLAKK